MVIDNHNYESWEDLMLNINHLFISYPDYVFRGQCQDDWKIESSLTRLLRESKLERDFDIFCQKQISNFKFKSRALGLNLKKMDEDEIWAIGQHHGLATPLIDWTYSPYVAIFFAIIGAEKSETGRRALYAFNLPDLENFKDEDKNLISLVEPRDDNKRLISQRGLFLKLSINEDFENVIKSQPKQDWVTFYKITFPDSIIQEALLGLDLMNINFSSLFPDFQGAGLATNNILKLYNFIYDLRDEQEKE